MTHRDPSAGVSLAALLLLGLCAAPALAQAPPPGARPPPPRPGVMPAPIGDWRPGDPRPPPGSALPPPPMPMPPPTASTATATASTPAPAAQTPAPPPSPAIPESATPPGADVPSAFPAWEAPPADAAPASAPVVAAAAPPQVVERVVEREVTPRWPWALALVLVGLALLWWRSHARAERLAQQSGALQRQQRHLQSAHRHLREQADRLQQTAVQDPLTGTRTRQAFAAEFETAVAHAAHFGQPAALLMFDLDHFKQINDTLGHAAGDEALKLVAGIVREKLTSSDLFGRYGGDEFLIGLAGSDGVQAARVAEEIRASLGRHVSEGRAPSDKLSLSIGVAAADPESGYDLDRLFQRADAALYAAKRGGRNRVVLADRVMPMEPSAQAPRTLPRASTEAG